MVLKLKTSEGEVFRFRLERCDLNEVQQYVLMACEGDGHHCFIAETARPLTEESLQEALSRADDGIIRVEIKEGNQNNPQNGGDNQAVKNDHQNMSNDMSNDMPK